ncbi:MAG: NADH-quinone oxidoreductase subunit M [Thiofilum sp.]|uniref:complex I subunit 4 family protein n=1 Tax=Thiofilum sp. TaxID=2212733 RepID=UPI00260042B2|nr:NADH-quinone oxidoreductase subunit M [Thiofilum sp.]MBK8452360.1 NADH-quinone oxidoreductase subunit M [Thiofilum sp.]
MNILIFLLLSPLIGAVLIFLLPSTNTLWFRRIALLSSLITLALSAYLYPLFNLTVATTQLGFSYELNPDLGTTFSLGIDGFSYPLILLTTLLTLIALLASQHINTYQRGYYGLILMLEAATLGVFMAQDWALFYILWELVLIPLFFLLDRWGGRERQAASLNFVLYTMGGSVFFLLSLLILFDKAPNHFFTFDAFRAAATHFNASEQALLLAGFIIGFGVKLPLFPLHGWLPLAYTQAPMPITLLLSGILSKMGAYGFIRAAELLPEGMRLLQPILLILGIMGVIYGGLLAWRQTHLKTMIAYSSFSHMGMVMVGIASLNVIGMTGAVLQITAHALTASTLFLVAGWLKRQTGTYELSQYSGLGVKMPRLILIGVLALAASIGVPGALGFVAELHTMLGSYAYQWLLPILLAGGMIITATYSLSFMRSFTGPTPTAFHLLTDISRSEFITALVPMLLVWILGFYPTPLLALSQASISYIIQVITAGGA